MDDAVIAALARWPNVPAVYGWLSLDRRGQWRLQGEPIRHRGLAAFISRNYAGTQDGEWFFQNGPQRVFVALDYTPWILRWSPDGGLLCHTGQPAEHPSGVWLDEEGNLLIAFAAGIGLVCDQDLAALMEHFGAAHQPEANDGPEAVEAFLGIPDQPLWLHLGKGALPVGRIDSGCVPTRFGFKPKPEPAPGPDVESAGSPGGVRD